MTEKLYYRDAYATKFTARVLDCTEEKKHWTVILDRTLFYPEGGGQPADIGVLGGVCVLDVHERGEDIVHTTDKPLSVGAEVEGEIFLYCVPILNMYFMDDFLQSFQMAFPGIHVSIVNTNRQEIFKHLEKQHSKSRVFASVTRQSLHFVCIITFSISCGEYFFSYPIHMF